MSPRQGVLLRFLGFFFFLLELWKEIGLIPPWEEGCQQGKEASDTPKETDSIYSDNSLELNFTVRINLMCHVYGVAKGGCVSREGHAQ